MLPPDPEDIKQEVALQRLLGRHVTPRIVRRRVLRDEARRAVAEEMREKPPGAGPVVDAARFPLLAGRLAGRDVAELLATHGIRSRTTLLRRLRTEYETWRATCH